MAVRGKQINPKEFILAAGRQLSKQKRLTDWLGENTSWENPFGDERARYPYAIFERERERGPMYWHKLYKGWVVLGYDEAQQVLTSPDFSSGVGMNELLAMHPYKRLSPGARDFVRGLLIFVDGDAHTRLRRLVSRAFTPRKVSALEPRIREIADSLLAEMPDAGEVDLFEAFTSKLPVQVIGELLGVPSARWSWLHDVTTEMTKLFDPIRGFEPVEMETAILELRGYIMALADTRRQTPTDDLISALVQINDDGDRLTLDELVELVGTLIFAGAETTSGLLGTAIVNLERYPDQRAALVADADLWPNAIEEFLRYDPPVTTVPRFAHCDTTVAGHHVKAGQLVDVMMSAANRDPRKYSDPQVMQLDRTTPSPLSFGHGIHYCIGAALSRATTRIGLQALLEGDSYTLDVDAVEWRTSTTLRGPLSLPLVFG